MKFTVAALLSVLALVSAAPAEHQLEARAATTCGKNSYTAAEVTAASKASCDYVKKGTTAGDSTYPHQYKNFEGFKFKGLKPPYYEFPIKKGGVFNGGPPGADRVIITKDCTEAGTITHTGATGNNFVACTDSETPDDNKKSAGFSMSASKTCVASGLGTALFMYML